MKKLSNISESIWSDIQKRSMGEQVRKEDDPFNFNEEFKKIKQMELINPKAEVHFGVDFLWTPCNFGAESYDQPGLYLNSEEIRALHKFLENTDYEIAGLQAFNTLQSRQFEKKKINNIWYYIFGSDEYKLYIPGFGHYAQGTPTPYFVPHSNGYNSIVYGCYFADNAGYVTLHKNKSGFFAGPNLSPSQTSNSDKFQVRLVKKNT